MKMTQGPSPVPTKVWRVPGGQWTKSHARSGRSSSSISSRHSPASTRKSSCDDSAWYIPVGFPGSSTASVKPSWANCCGSTPGPIASTRPLLSNTQRPPKASWRSQAASATLTTNHPGEVGASPEPTSSRRASSTITSSSLRRGFAGDPDRVFATCVRPAVEPAVAGDYLEARLLEQRPPFVVREPGEHEGRRGAPAAHRQCQRARVRVPVGTLEDPGFALEPAAVRVGDVLRARREDVEHEPAARQEQLAGRAQRP